MQDRAGLGMRLLVGHGRRFGSPVGAVQSHLHPRPESTDPSDLKVVMPISAQPLRECHPPVLPRQTQLTVLRYRGRRPRQHSAVHAHRVCQGQRTRALRLPASRVHRTAQGAIAPAMSKPCSRPGSPCRSGQRLTPRTLPRQTSIAPLPGRLRIKYAQRSSRFEYRYNRRFDYSSRLS